MDEDVDVTPEVAEGIVCRVGGPGSVDIMIRTHLADLRQRLGEANHPLAMVPQWNGGRFYLVHLTAGQQGRIMLLTGRDAERVEETALANASTRNGPEWTVGTLHEVELLPSRMLQADLELACGEECCC